MSKTKGQQLFGALFMAGGWTSIDASVSNMGELITRGLCSRSVLPVAMYRSLMAQSAHQVDDLVHPWGYSQLPAKDREQRKGILRGKIPRLCLIKADN